MNAEPFLYSSSMIESDCLGILLYIVRVIVNNECDLLHFLLDRNWVAPMV